jgi:aspartate beta-hydroxylase
MSRAYDASGALLRAVYGWRIAGQPVLDPNVHWPGVERFSRAWEQIRDEALRIADNLSAVPRFHELMPQQAPISASDGRDWRLFVIKAYGALQPVNAARCPVLAELTAAAPEVLSVALSFLAPRKHVPEHRGPFRGVVRYYLGLSVPPDASGRPGTVLTIDGREFRIGSGQGLLWDDTFAHEVRNDTDETRIALLLDVRRGAMPLDMEVLSRAILAAAGVAARRRMKRSQAFRPIHRPVHRQ